MGARVHTAHVPVRQHWGVAAAFPQPLLSSGSPLSSLSFHMFPSRSCLSGIHQNLWTQRATHCSCTVLDWFPFYIFAAIPVGLGKRGGRHVNAGWSQKLLILFYFKIM